MNIWEISNHIAWVGCALFTILILFDFIRIELASAKAKKKKNG